MLDSLSEFKSLSNPALKQVKLAVLMQTMLATSIKNTFGMSLVPLIKGLGTSEWIVRNHYFKVQGLAVLLIL